MPLRDICQENFVTVEPNATLLDAAKLMKDRHVGTLIVVEQLAGNVKPVGIVTDRDIALAVADNRPLTETKIDAMMSRNLRLATADDGIAETTELMSRHSIRRMPVVDGRGTLVGIVSTDDLFRLLATELMSLASICERQIAKEGAPKALANVESGWSNDVRRLTETL